FLLGFRRASDLASRLTALSRRRGGGRSRPLGRLCRSCGRWGCGRRGSRPLHGGCWVFPLTLNYCYYPVGRGSFSFFYLDLRQYTRRRRWYLGVHFVG